MARRRSRKRGAGPVSRVRSAITGLFRTRSAGKRTRRKRK